MNKILTIIIPTYNMEKYLRRCLDSLIIDEEGMKQLEVLVINDGSKDSSSQIAHEYQDKYPDTYRVIDKENGNYGSCINRGLKEATGKYVKVLDADDWYNTKGLARHIRKLSSLSDDIDAVFSLYNKRDHNDIVIFTQPTYIDDNLVVEFSEYDFLTYALRALTMHSITYKKDLLIKIKLKLQHGISYTDLEYLYFPMKYLGKIAFDNNYIYQYFIGRKEQTISISSKIKSVDNYYKVGSRILRDYVLNIDKRKETLCRNQRHIIVLALYMYFYLNLLWIKPTSEACKNLVELYGLAQKSDRNIFVHIKKINKLPFIWIWEKFGIILSKSSAFRRMYKYLKEK